MLSPMAILSSLVLALVLVFAWYRWIFTRAYKQFPCTRMDTTWLLRLVLGWYPRKFTPTSLFFTTIVERTRPYQSEGLCLVWLFRPMLIVYGDKIIKDLFYDSNLANKSSLFEITREVFRNGLVGQDGDSWKMHRRQLNPAFSLNVLKGKIPVYNYHAVDLVEKLQEHESRTIENLVHFLKDCSFNVMSESVLGFRMDNEKYTEKAQKFKKSLARASNLGFARLSYPWLVGPWLLPFSSLGKRYLGAVAEMRRFTYEIVEEIKKSITCSGNGEKTLDSTTEKSKSMAQVLLQQHLRNPVFSAEDLRDHFENIIIAGFDSTAVAIMWCLYLLGHNPEEQERVYNEIMSIVPEGHVTYDHLGKLKYLDCVLKETLRMYPPLPFYARKAKKEIRCGTYTIPKGTDVVFSPYLLHRNPHVYPEPEKFDPERFAVASKIRPWMYITFAEGYRNCIGKKFATMEAKIVVAHVVRRFKITSLNRIEESELDYTMVLKPAKRMQISFTGRRCQSCHRN